MPWIADKLTHVLVGWPIDDTCLGCHTTRGGNKLGTLSKFTGNFLISVPRVEWESGTAHPYTTVLTELILSTRYLYFIKFDKIYNKLVL